MATSTRGEFLQQVYHHVVLPRDVPGREDHNLSFIEAEILERLIHAVEDIIPCLPYNDQPRVDSVRLTLTTAKALNVYGKIDKRMLVEELRNFEGSHMFVLFVSEQNAALLVYRKARYV